MAEGQRPGESLGKFIKRKAAEKKAEEECRRTMGVGSLTSSTVRNEAEKSTTGPQKKLGQRWCWRCPSALFNTAGWMAGCYSPATQQAQMRAQNKIQKFVESMKTAGREVRVLNQWQKGAVFDVWSSASFNEKSMPELPQELQRCKRETQVREIFLYGENMHHPKYAPVQEDVETLYTAEGSVARVPPVWECIPEERHDYSHDGVQLQLQQLALRTSGATAEDVKEMEMLKKMAETMSLDDISAHLVEEACKVFAMMRENLEQEVE